jgi:hypothetical protein
VRMRKSHSSCSSRHSGGLLVCRWSGSVRCMQAACTRPTHLRALEPSILVLRHLRLEPLQHTARCSRHDLHAQFVLPVASCCAVLHNMQPAVGLLSAASPFWLDQLATSSIRASPAKRCEAVEVSPRAAYTMSTSWSKSGTRSAPQLQLSDQCPAVERVRCQSLEPPVACRCKFGHQ